MAKRKKARNRSGVKYAKRLKQSMRARPKRKRLRGRRGRTHV